MPANQQLTVPSAGPADQGRRSLTPEQSLAVDVIVDCQLTHTWEEIRAECGVSRATLSRWRKQPEFRNEVTKRSRLLVREHLPTAYQALILKVAKGDIPALKLFFELTGEIQEAKLRELFGTWMSYLAIAGKGNIQQLVGMVQDARRAQGGATAAIDAEITVVDEVPAAEETAATAEVPFDEI